MNRPLLDKDFLIKEYVEAQRSSPDIAKQCGCTHKTVLDYLKRYKISYRNKYTLLPTSVIGNKYGKFTVLKFDRRAKNNAFYFCRCSCGKERIVGLKSLKEGKSTQCGECNRKSRFVGYKEISGTYIKSLKTKAFQKDRDFEVSLKYLWGLFLKQKRRCALSGIPIVFSYSFADRCKTQTASLDRIDSSKGYVKSNVQWVHKRINAMKNNMSDTEFMQWCCSVCSFRGK